MWGISLNQPNVLLQKNKAHQFKPKLNGLIDRLLFIDGFAILIEHVNSFLYGLTFIYLGFALAFRSLW